MMNHATVEDFIKWETKAKSMSIAELFYSARDCRQAVAAMRGWNPIAEGRYSDEAYTYGDEIRRRRQGTVSRTGKDGFHALRGSRFLLY